MYNLIANGNISVAEAIALSAYEFGLLDEVSAQVLRKAMVPCSNCTCMDAARKVLQTYFDRRSHAVSGSVVNTEEIWKGVESDAKRYASNESKNQSADDCCHDCAKFAPALFDLLLQQIRRYP